MQKNKKNNETFSKVQVTQVASNIACSKNQRQTLFGLGLFKINQKRVLELNDSVKGMIKRVHHLVKVEFI